MPKYVCLTYLSDVGKNRANPSEYIFAGNRRMGLSKYKGIDQSTQSRSHQCWVIQLEQFRNSPLVLGEVIEQHSAEFYFVELLNNNNNRIMIIRRITTSWETMNQASSKNNQLISKTHEEKEVIIA